MLHDPLNWTSDDQERALDAISRWYDLDFGPLTDDVDMILDLVSNQPDQQQVLELGAGSGRIAVPLAEAGYEITAVDSSVAMLRLGEQRLREAGVNVIRGDMRSLSLDKSFQLALIGLSTFQHLLRRSDQLAVLGVARSHLAPGGRLLIDWTAPRPDDVDPAPRPMQLEWVRQSESGDWVTKHAAQELALDRTCGNPLDRASAIAWITYQYDAAGESGAVRRSLARFPLRVNLTAGEMAGLLAEAGLVATDWFGSWEFDEPGEGDRLIVVAQEAA